MKSFLHKFCLVAGFLMMVSGVAYAQQEAMYSQYMFNGLILNPAYAGSQDGLTAAALYRNQWVGVEGAPVTQTFSLHAPVKNDKVGLGLSVVNDEIGVTNTLSANGVYAYRIQLNRGVLSMGLQAGVTKIRADYTKVKLNPQDNPDQQFTDVQNFLTFNFGNGLYYYTDKFYAGVSAPNLFRTKLSSDTDDAYPKHARHYFISSGYVFDLGENVKLKPSTIIKVAEGAPVQFDVNANVWLHNFIGLGASYRSNNALVGLVEMQIAKQLRIGYAYDHPTSNISRYTANTHEVMLRFDAFRGDQRYVSPRLF